MLRVKISYEFCPKFQKLTYDDVIWIFWCDFGFFRFYVSFFIIAFTFDENANGTHGR